MWQHVGRNWCILAHVNIQLFPPLTHSSNRSYRSIKSFALAKCNVATCWPIELSILSLFHLSLELFPLKIVLGLALDESCVLLGQQQKNNDILHVPVLVGGGKTQPSPPTSYRDRTPSTRTWAHLRAWGSIREIGCWYVNGCCCNPAFLILPYHVLKMWRRVWSFFINPNLKAALGLAWDESCALLVQPPKNSKKVYLCWFPWEGFPRQTCLNHLRPKKGCCRGKAWSFSA